MKIKKLFITVLLLFSLLTTFTGCFRSPEPTVKEGEFNFSITYEVDGEVKTVASVFRCEFVDSVMALDAPYVEWDTSILDNDLAVRLEENRGYLLLKECDDGIIYLDLNLSAKYFMSDPNYNNSNNSENGISPRLFIEYNQTKGEELGEWWAEDATVLSSYGVRVISYEYDAPIENTYK